MSVENYEKLGYNNCVESSVKEHRHITGVDYMTTVISLIFTLIAIFIILVERFGLYEKAKKYIKYIQLSERCIFVIISLVIFFKK